MLMFDVPIDVVLTFPCVESIRHNYTFGQTLQDAELLDSLAKGWNVDGFPLIVGRGVVVAYRRYHALLHLRDNGYIPATYMVRCKFVAEDAVSLTLKGIVGAIK